MAYAEYGAPDGTPVVFFHGTPGSRLLGAVLDAPAKRHGVRVLAPDRPGYGRSDPRSDRTLADAGETVAAVLDDAGIDRAGVVGFSGGGPHALAAAATRPDRVTRVDVVAGSAPPSSLDDRPGVVRLIETLAGTAPRLLGGLFSLQAGVAKRTSPSTVVSQYTTDGGDHVPDDVATVVRDDFVEAFARGSTGAVTEFRLLGQAWPFSLSDVERPVHLWHGGRDENAPVEAARKVADRLPDAELAVFEDADHLGTLVESRDRILDGYAADGETR